MLPPGEGRPALLTHDDVLTLFHEFGHGLHHLLTRVDYPSIAGINGVAWDAVELPSQFMENYAWHPDVLGRISSHYQTGAPLPAQTQERLRATRSFHAGLQMVRQLEFALFDFRLHAEYSPERGGRVREVLQEARRQVAVVPVPEWNRFANSFGHIFAGGYAAGYYSYKWAEVLAADAFSAFEEQGVFDRATAQRFLDCHPLAGRQPRRPGGLRRVPGPAPRDPAPAGAARHRGPWRGRLSELCPARSAAASAVGPLPATPRAADLRMQRIRLCSTSQ